MDHPTPNNARDAKRPAPRKETGAAQRSSARYANWTVGLAAALLVLVSAGGYVRHRGQLAAIATEHLRLIVTGPSSLQDGAAAEYTISATAVDGRALPAEIEAALLDSNGERIKTFRETADANGRLKIVITAETKLPRRVALKTAARHRGNLEEAEAGLTVEPDPFDTRLTLDRSTYRPGEKVHFRSRTLSRFRLEEAADRQVVFEIVGPDGRVLPGSKSESIGSRGVAAGVFSIPADLSDGRYAAVVRGGGQITPVRQEFTVRRVLAERPPSAVPDNSAQSGSAAPREPKPPEPASRFGVSLLAGESEFEAAAPLQFHVRSAKSGRPLVAAAYVNGAQVGQKPFLSAGNSGAGQPVRIEPDPAVGGPIRLVLFDYGATPPERLAERIVYRRPGRELNVHPFGAEKLFSPGESVELTLQVTDETGRPVPAALGVFVGASENDAIDNSRGQTAPGGKTQDANADRGPLAPGYFNETLDAEQTAAAKYDPPLMLDNLERINADYEKNLADYLAVRTGGLNTLTAASFFGGLGLVLMVAMLGLMRIVSGMHLWVSAVGATTCCMILGAILMDPGRLSTAHETGVAFATYVGQPPSAGPSKSAQPGTAVTHGSTNDFAETVFWRPLLIAGQDGKATVRFDLPKKAGAFDILIEAHGAGRIGSRRTTIVVRPPETETTITESDKSI